MRFSNLNFDAVLAQIDTWMTDMEAVLPRVENVETVLATLPGVSQYAAPALALTEGAAVAGQLVEQVNAAITQPVAARPAPVVQPAPAPVVQPAPAPVAAAQAAPAALSPAAVIAAAAQASTGG